MGLATRTEMHVSVFALLALASCTQLIGWLISLIICRFSIRCGFGQALLWSLLASVLGTVGMFGRWAELVGGGQRVNGRNPYYSFNLGLGRMTFGEAVSYMASLVCAWLFMMLLVLFVVRLARKWMGGHLTEDEQRADATGVRAWLNFGNVFAVIVLTLTGWWGFGMSPLTILFCAGGAVLVYPIVNLMSHAAGAAAPAPRPESLSSEREHVLRMLEEGKITAEESSELLSALGESVPRVSAQPAPMTAPRKLLLIGSALVLLGFFLPWLSINPGKEMSRNQFSIEVPGAPRWNGRSLGPKVVTPPSIRTPTMSFSGGDIDRGYGWLVLFIGIGAGVLPFVTSLTPTSRRSIGLIGLGVGAVVLLFLLTRSMRHVNVGLVVVTAGYVLAFIGTLRDSTNGRTIRSGVGASV